MVSLTKVGMSRIIFSISLIITLSVRVGLVNTFALPWTTSLGTQLACCLRMVPPWRKIMTCCSLKDRLADRDEKKATKKEEKISYAEEIIKEGIQSGPKCIWAQHFLNAHLGHV